MSGGLGILELVHLIWQIQVKEEKDRREIKQAKGLLDLIIFLLDNFQNTK